MSQTLPDINESPSPFLTTDWTVGNNSSRSLESIIMDLDNRLNILGFDSFIYQGAPSRMQHDLRKPASHRLILMRNIEECSTMVCSNPRLLPLIRYYYQDFAANDLNFERSTRLREPFIHHYSWQPLTRTDRTQAFFQAAGIHSILNWPVNVMTGQHWSGLFRLHSQQPEEALGQHLCRIRQELSHILLIFHLELVGNYRNCFNPYRNMSLFSDNAFKVVTGLSRGKGRKQIASELGISERGVDYHTQHLCDKLDAKNKMDLIRICYELDIISV